MNRLFNRKLNAWDQLVYDTLHGTVRPEDRLYSPFDDRGLPSANERILSGLGRTYTILPTNLRMGEDEVSQLLNQALESYKSHTPYTDIRIEDARAVLERKLRQNSFEVHLKQATGGKLRFGASYDREAYDATQGLVKAEREMAAAKQRQAEQQAQQKAAQEKEAARQQAEAESARKAAEEQTRQMKQFKASTESGNLQSGGDAPTIITGRANSPTTNDDLNIGRGGNRRRGASLSSVLGLF